MIPFWLFVHNTLVHPLGGVCQLATWGKYVPAWLVRLHDVTAARAGVDGVETEQEIADATQPVLAHLKAVHAARVSVIGESESVRCLDGVKLDFEIYGAGAEDEGEPLSVIICPECAAQLAQHVYGVLPALRKRAGHAPHHN